jgi:hypothetical protein
VDDAARRVPEMRARLERATIPFSAVAPIAPTFEDVFVASVSAPAEGGS